METTYKPHPYAKSIILPQIPTSVSLSAIHNGHGLQQWFRGLSSTPVAHFTPEALEISEQRWRAKWEYYNQTFREEVEQAALGDMPRRELLEYLERLESEFTRLRDRFIEIDTIKVSAEVATGVQFILSLIEPQTPAISQLKAAETGSQNDEQLRALRQQVKAIDRVYKFALQSSDSIHRIKVLEMLGSRAGNDLSDSQDIERGSQGSVEPGSSIAASPRQPTPELSTTKEGQKVQFAGTNASPRFRGDVIYPPSGSTTVPTAGDSENGPTNSDANLSSSRVHRSTYGLGAGDAYMSQPRRQRRLGDNDVPNPPATQTLSTAASHRSNLVSLSAISFFGAGMAWATVFSGTRGDLVLISWAACCFIIGAVGAASATSLLDTDGELLSRYTPVRWTVRLLAVWSTLHVFAGVMLVSAAILVLDPNAGQPGPGIKGGGDFVVRNGRVAGGYSLVVCAVVVLVALVIRH
ncbi:hypothetical protein FS749_010241 [Ceratobasidium sp. UAMH 11750]|nr:hypothetical protein FS749_010241 [Ceratobasidium sp. UAMH 11750]